jgi:hypothetical protein
MVYKTESSAVFGLTWWGMWSEHLPEFHSEVQLSFRQVNQDLEYIDDFGPVVL